MIDNTEFNCFEETRGKIYKGLCPHCNGLVVVKGFAQSYFKCPHCRKELYICSFCKLRRTPTGGCTTTGCLRHRLKFVNEYKDPDTYLPSLEES